MNLNKEVCGLFGWAIWSVKNNLKKAKDQNTDIVEETKFLHNMTYTHAEAMCDNDYINNHYSMFDMLRNCGGMTLIHPNYMSFAKTLMIKLISIIDINEMMKQTSKFCKESRLVMKSDVSLFVQFDNCRNTNDLSQSLKKKLYYKLWNKSFNARLGAEKKRFVQEHMGHCTDAATVAFRQSLQVFNKKTSIEAATNFSSTAVSIKKEKLLKE
jgi:hypothetical protein